MFAVESLPNITYIPRSFGTRTCHHASVLFRPVRPIRSTGVTARQVSVTYDCQTLSSQNCFHWAILWLIRPDLVWHWKCEQKNRKTPTFTFNLKLIRTYSSLIVPTVQTRRYINGSVPPYRKTYAKFGTAFWEMEIQLKHRLRWESDPTRCHPGFKKPLG